MVELIHLIDDISTPVKLGWAAVLIWGVVQILWYQRARVLPGREEDAQPANSWSLGGLLARLGRSTDDQEAVPNGRPGSLSIASAMEFTAHEMRTEEPDLGAAAGLALENLLDDKAGIREDASHGRQKSVSYQSILSY